MTTAANQLLFTGSYTAADQTGIHAFEFDEADGSLIPLAAFDGIANPSFLVVHPQRDWLYTVSETGLASDGRHGTVHAFRFQRDPVSIQLINQRSSDGDWPCHLAIDASGRWLLVSNYGSGNAAVYPIEDDGALGEMSDFVQHEGKGPNQARQEGPHAHSATLTPDNQFVIIADLGIDQLVTYRLGAKDGRLTRHLINHTSPGAGPRHIAFHPNGQILYLANELDNTVNVYTYEAVSGVLHEVETLRTLPAGAPENTVADIHISSSGRHLYVSNRGHSSIAVYAVADDGRLTSLGFPSCGGEWPRNFGLSPDGRWILVANRHSNEVVVMPLQKDGAELGRPVMRAEISQPSCVRFAIR